MMFSIIRLIIGCIFLGCSIILLKAKSIRKHLPYVVVTSISVALVVVFAFLPFENLFITFNSPKESYEYYNGRKSNLVLVVEGNDCDFIVDRQNDSDTYLIIPKNTDGWKIGIGSDTKRIVQKISDGITVYVYQYKSTNDYFITILNTNGGSSNITDNYNTRFYALEKTNDYLGKTFVTYYAHISKFGPQYRLVVNGHAIAL